MKVDSLHHPALGPLASTLAALCIASSPLSLAPPAAMAASPTATELARIPEGLARIDLLLKDWDAITTVCNGSPDEVEMRQVMTTTGAQKCSKSPLRVQQFIGASSTLDPLFKADKLMIRATPLVAEEDQEAFTAAVDLYITKQQIASTMAYTSSWSGFENPNGSTSQIEESLLEAKREVAALRGAVKEIVDLLHLPPALPITRK
jgi:hypothetical protein